MKKTYLLLSFVFVASVLFSCKSSTKKSNSISYGYKENFKLSENEQEINSADLVNLYETIYNYPNFNLPLNKVVTHEDYQIFIAAAIENSEQETIDQILKTEEFEFIESENSTKFSKQLLYNYNDLYIYSVIYAEKFQEIPFVISWVSKNQELITKAYHNQLLDEKIN